MKHLQRSLALILCLTMLIPAWLPLSAGALEDINTTKESYTFYQRGTERILNANEQSVVDSYADFTSAYQSSTFIRDQASDAQTSWALAAIAALDAAYGKYGTPTSIGDGEYRSSFSDTHMIFSLSSDTNNTLGFARAFNGAGNRLMATAYIMRGKLGGPVTGYPSYPGATYILPQNLEITEDNGERHFVSGVTFIPDPQVTGAGNAKSLYISRIKDAVYKSGAVAVSLYMDTNYFFEGQYADEYLSDTKRDIYHYPYRVTADHSVAIVGWNDDDWKYEIPAPTTDEPDKTTTVENTGAFLVRDSMIDGGVEYWVSYETFLSGAYFIEGFIDENESVDYEYTYEYDIFGFGSAMGYSGSSALFANVFTVAGAADSLEAVSVFYTGESTTVSLYYIPDYTGVDDLKAYATKGIKVLDNVTKTLPGYYCFPLESPIIMGAKGSQYAIVAIADCKYGSTPIPVQNTVANATTGTGRSYISAKGTSWTDSYAQGQATVCLKAHVKQNVDIPLVDVSVEAGKDPETGAYYHNDKSGLNTLYVAPGQSRKLGPVYEPLNATDVASSSVVWTFRDSDGKLLVEVDKDSDATVRIEVPQEYEEDEEKPSVPTFQYASGTLTIPADNLSGSYIVEVEVYTFLSDEDEDEDEDDRLLSDTAFTARGSVDIRPVEATSITVNKTELTLKAAGTSTVSATITPSDSSYKTVTWRVAPAYEKVGDSYVYTSYKRGYDAGDPYHPDGPLATVSEKGKITALRDGVCYVYAEIAHEDVSVTSPPIKVTITQADPTGVTVSKKKLTMSLGTKLTNKATVKPSSASNKRVAWSSDNANIVSIDPILGIMEAKAVGTANITVTNALGATAVCEVTVTNAPSNTIKLTKNTTLSLSGATSNDTVVWEITEEGLGFNLEEPLASTYFTAASASKVKLKMTAKTVGEVLVRAYISAESYDTNGEVTNERPIIEQSWRVNAVVALTKLAMQDDRGETVTKVTLCVDPSGKRASQTASLTSVVVKPTDGTLLDFEWKSSKPAVATVDVPGGANPSKATIMVNALSVGTTKITGTNYNSNKKVSVTIKVMAFPSDIAFRKEGPLTLAIGKTVSSKATVSGVKGVNKNVVYSLEDEAGNTLSDNENGIAVLDKRGKVKAVGEGTVYLVARGAPFTDDSLSTRIAIVCKTLVKRVGLTANREMSAGTSQALGVTINPTNATVQDVTVSSSAEAVATVTKNADGTYTIQAKAPGRAKITVVSADNPKRKKSLTIKVS